MDVNALPALYIVVYISQIFNQLLLAVSSLTDSRISIFLNSRMIKSVRGILRNGKHDNVAGEACISETIILYRLGQCNYLRNNNVARHALFKLFAF